MITLRELNPHGYETTPEIDSNLSTLLTRLNVIRAAWGRPMIVTSGLRSIADQMRINPNAPKSKHLIGAAADISDPKRELQTWLLKNRPLLKKTGLWCEHFSATANWVHMQCLPSKSGKRFFPP